MENRLTAAMLLATVWLTSSSYAETDWKVWRGPTRDNHVPSAQGQGIPTTWSDSENILWKSPIPGRGHATPIVVDDGVYILTHEASNQTISLLRYRISDGKPLGRATLHRNVTPPAYLHQKNTCASSTPSSDGKTIYTVAQVNTQIVASAISTRGKILWQQNIADYRGGPGWFGFGASPLLLDDQLIIAVDVNNQAGGLFSLDCQTGRQRWKSPRTESTSYSTPIIAEVASQKMILISGGYRVVAYSPQDGRKLWDVPATSRTTCGTMVWNDSMAFASGSFPDPGTYGINLTASGAQIAWENNVKCYEPSMLVVGEYLYGLSNSGVAYCWRCGDGKEMWKQRLRGPFSASPLLIGDQIYASNERGTTYVFPASPDGYKSVAENLLGDSSFASPIVADGKLLLRHASNESGGLQEYLYAIGR